MKSGILQQHTEQSTDIFNNIDESEIHYTINGKKTASKAYTVILFIRYYGKGKMIRHGEGISNCQSLGLAVGSNEN